jgi:ABC-2 type transport system permease protein
VTGASTLSATPGTAHDVAAARVFVRTCAAEWTRLWTVRTTWGFVAAAAVAMVGIGALAGLEAAADPVPPEGDPAWAVSAVAAMPAQFALLALALIAVTSDYATGGIVPTLQWTPRRTVLCSARAIVAVGVATTLGVLLGIGSAVAASVAAPGLSLPWDVGLDVLATVAFVFATGTSLAVGLGFLLRNTAGALVTVFLLMLLLPVLLPQFGYEWMSALASVLPGSGAVFLLLGEVPRMTEASWVTALLAWAGGALLLGWLRLLRNDANR